MLYQSTVLVFSYKYDPQYVLYATRDHIRIHTYSGCYSACGKCIDSQRPYTLRSVTLVNGKKMTIIIINNKIKTTGGAAHVKWNVISRMRKIGWIRPSAVHSSEKNMLIQAGSFACVHGNRGDQVFLEYFWKGCNTGRRGKKKKNIRWNESCVSTPLPMEMIHSISVLISSYTCKMTSECCICLRLLLPSDTGLYTESGSGGRGREGLDGWVRAISEDRVDWFKKRKGREQVITKWGRRREEEHGKLNQMSELNFRRRV